MPRDLPPPTDDELTSLIDSHKHLEGPLLPILHAIQAMYGHIPQTAIALLAEALNISRADVHGVISFYHDFRDAPAGQHVVKLCRAEACQARGGKTLSEAILNRLGVDWHGTTPDGKVTVEPVYCLGLCACGPAAMLDEQVVGRVTPDKLDRMLKEADA